MGNTPSVPRGQPDDGQLEELGHTRTATQRWRDDFGGDGRSSRIGRRNPQSLRMAGQRASSLYDTFRNHRSADSVNARPSAGRPVSGEVGYEQENRPLVGGGDVEMMDTIRTPITSLPTFRRRTAMSRLGSRLLPESVARSILNSGEETAQEGEALRNAMVEGSRTSIYEMPHGEASGRVSLTGSIRRRGDNRSHLRRRAIRGPYPLSHERQESFGNGSSRGESLDRVRRLSPPAVDSVRPRNRFSRIRSSVSISSRISSMFGHSTDQFDTTLAGRDISRGPISDSMTNGSNHSLPSLQSVDPRHDGEEAPHELDAVEPEARNLLSGGRVTSGMSTIRRFQPGLRSRSTRLIRRGEHPPLSQVLQLAAAAIAAQLSGHATTGHPGGRHTGGGDTFDGNIQDFVQTLQDAATAQSGDNLDGSAADGELPPVNFMRVFQFPNDENGSPIASQAQSRDVDQMDLDSITGAGENDRSVTLVLVGVRSLPHGRDHSSGDNGTLGPSLDTLLSLPFLPPTNVLRNGSSGALFRRSEGRARSNPRRHSMTNFSFPAQYETQRHQRSRTNVNRSSNHSDRNVPTTPEAGGASHLISESPPGPNPPPSTPADIRSGQATPIRRPSSASAVQNPVLPDLAEDRPQQEDPESSSHEPAFNAARQRRRSDSEFARRPELGSGAARRNGVVEPDHPPSGVARSWLIYVVGTNVSPDHPAFTMPSLFTDSPSYEDMQLLSTLLGPVKPPVATQEDVSSAGGLYRLVVQNDGFVGEAITDGDATSIIVNAGERCLICLSDYADSEELRRLDKCHHLYHRDCIDEWLTTGRNSCPMCRGQGVPEKARASNIPPSSTMPTTI
ncbi:hypothetical protein ABEF93_005262 [Exophiala dermatitidis]